MPLPRASRQLVKLLPVAFVPSRHFVHAVCCSLSHTFFDVALDAGTGFQVASYGPNSLGIILYVAAATSRVCRSEPAKDIRLRTLDEIFPRLLFQTRYRAKLFRVPLLRLP
jgi:hypothetical protein